MGIGLIFFDLDGTVYRDFSTISERTFAAFDAVKARGTVLVAASGRSLRFMPPPLEEWGGLDYFIGANGVCTYDVRTGECLHEGAIPPSAALEIMELTADLDAAWLAFYDDIVMRETKSHYYLALEMRRTGIPDARAYGFFSAGELEEVYGVDASSVDSFDLPMGEDRTPFVREHEGSIHKLAATFPSPEAAEEAFSRLKGLPIIEAAHTAGVEIEVSAAGFTKGSSSAWLASRLGIPRERTVAFGDAGNDISFAGNVGRLIAVGSRSAALVAVADEVTLPIEEDGVAVWIENHLDQFGAER
ncbi:MAG: HAD hydrolase family protein [Atopobiaceae bacterium]|nr:HAD hydrolase family protein [Atopobiaceae bacterium]